MPLFNGPEFVPKGQPHIPRIFRDSGQRRHTEAVRRSTQAMQEIATLLSAQMARLTGHHTPPPQPKPQPPKRNTRPTGKMWLQRLEAHHRRGLVLVHGEVPSKELDALMVETLFSLDGPSVLAKLREISEARESPPDLRTIQRALRVLTRWRNHRSKVDRPDKLTRQEGPKSQAELSADEFLKAAGEDPNRVSFTPKK